MKHSNLLAGIKGSTIRPYNIIKGLTCRLQRNDEETIIMRLTRRERKNVITRDRNHECYFSLVERRAVPSDNIFIP